MNESFRFPRPGFWALQTVVVAAAFAGGVALGVFHATGHGAADAHATHGAPAPDADAKPDAHDAHATHTAPATPPPPAGASPIRDEMNALQGAVDAMNRAIVLGDATGVAERFHEVHLLKERTSAAIRAGTAKPPKNGDRIEDFVARDEAFHALLGTTVKAASENDIPTLQRMSGELQGACIGCHAEFRGSP